MWTRLTVSALVLASTACATNRSDETGRASSDTVVTNREVVDTTVITTDTNISVDTTKIEGDEKEAPSITVDTTNAPQ